MHVLFHGIGHNLNSVLELTSKWKSASTRVLQYVHYPRLVSLADIR